MLGQDTPKLDFRSGATWVVPWLLGLLVISWLGNYPEPAAGNQMVLSFSSAIPIIFVFSVLIYVLAYRSALPTSEVEEHVESSRAEAELEEQELDRA